MKRFLILGFFCLLISVIVVSCANPFASPGEKLFTQAKEIEMKTEYFGAFDHYLSAITKLRAEGKIGQVNECRDALTRVEKITSTYSLSEEAARGMIKQALPDIPESTIDQVIKEGRLPSLKIGGTVYYFVDFLNTLAHIYPKLRGEQSASALGKSTNFFQIMSRYIYAKDDLLPGQTLTNPISYRAKGEISIPRKSLPDKGLYKVWLPLPLVTAAQQDIKLISIYPREYLKYPLKQDGDLGVAYFEIPLEEIKDDLSIGLEILFTHYEERFKVDPDKIGQYDRQSPLYKQYTASGKNIALTPAIRAKARQLAGREKNPYKIAKIFYDHIVWDLDYSFTPHLALEALKIPESVFVQEQRYGDCGAQSMYFAALCRSVGIPARASGGLQLFPVNDAGCGDHFWAQIYLPNYGWVPVDTSAGQIAKYMPQLTSEEQHDFANYYFGKMDPFRYLIQHDVDLPLTPPPDRTLAFGMVLQSPTALCSEMDRNPGLTIMDGWQMTVTPIR
ncbi:MAG: transglutaminase-like domain-containing protein [Candidatus Margulisbacteria bacterium]|nr:transglutaminase-like domain-containing protein [Candidatus Margulisiibacteriota bacterium]MBU1617532.1 transglutaminase-like domain-containing protein [Candidatus Margulisiibacteriota bacterium]MBU1867158.1 transglutaminase-like domain-containing protein [Candidatus Margulisiibacteriota bacterium]